VTIRSAIILAAGRGSRLGGATRDRPKSLVRLGGRSLIQWQIAALHAAGIDDIAIVGGYRAQALAQIRGVRLLHNPAWQRSGPIASLCCAQPESLGAGFLLMYADCLIHPRWIAAVCALRGAIGVTSDRAWHALWSARFADVLADAECFRSVRGELIEIGGRAQRVENIEGQFTGLVKFSATGWARVRKYLAGLSPRALAALDTTSLLAALLHQGVRIGVAPIDGGWCEVDSSDDLALYRRCLRRRAWQHDWRWPEGESWA
jgi:choline kinase